MKEVDNIKLLQESFEPFLYKSNPHVVASLKRLGMDDNRIRRTELFDWFQGVGLYGYYQAHKKTGDRHILEKIIKYYDTRIKDGLPEKNINSMAPLLTMVMMLDEGLVPGGQHDLWHQVVVEWAKWLMDDHPRTKEGGFSHLTCEAENRQELWDDTLFMAVLFLAKAGMYLEKEAYVEEAVYQFLIHQEYLLDRQSGLWFHGWTFDGNHNFAEAKWNRGNSWITLFVPLFLDIVKDYELATSIRRLMIETYNRQVKAILDIELTDDLWPTLLDDPHTYGESSGSAAIIFGMKMGLELGILYEDTERIHRLIDRVSHKIKSLIDRDGILGRCSGGTAMGKDSLDYYRNIPIEPKPYGQALAMLALM